MERSGKGSRKAVRLFGKRRSNGALQAWRLRRRADKAKSATTREGDTEVSTIETFAESAVRDNERKDCLHIHSKHLNQQPFRRLRRQLPRKRGAFASCSFFASRVGADPVSARASSLHEVSEIAFRLSALPLGSPSGGAGWPKARLRGRIESKEKENPLQNSHCSHPERAKRVEGSKSQEYTLGILFFNSTVLPRHT